jgi:hypothetical protein
MNGGEEREEERVKESEEEAGLHPAENEEVVFAGTRSLEEAEVHHNDASLDEEEAEDGRDSEEAGGVGWERMEDREAGREAGRDYKEAVGIGSKRVGQEDMDNSVLPYHCENACELANFFQVDPSCLVTSS